MTSGAVALEGGDLFGRYTCFRFHVFFVSQNGGEKTRQDGQGMKPSSGQVVGVLFIF